MTLLAEDTNSFFNTMDTGKGQRTGMIFPITLPQNVWNTVHTNKYTWFCHQNQNITIWQYVFFFFFKKITKIYFTIFLTHTMSIILNATIWNEDSMSSIKFHFY